jgi:hypothetical protein
VSNISIGLIAVIMAIIAHQEVTHADSILPSKEVSWIFVSVVTWKNLSTWGKRSFIYLPSLIAFYGLTDTIRSPVISVKVDLVLLVTKLST